MKKSTREVKDLMISSGWRCGYHFILTEFSSHELYDSLARSLNAAKKYARENDKTFDERSAVDDFKLGYSRSFGKYACPTGSF